ncbi:uncharacterized protein BDZ99DRAFT_526534 [Mytilinidion resinicola]|uniref:Uncharacterized protein n=1 Tax=Mytilinidion resinicola TaxID=574789 RepID=A0A6A6Y495_9PEZI|nr:uncharacterized protein BDZ99DRAFT_526534 [Mytilinidion resinicola]KAF2803612.1 hypothetical protein BDZ99DRAFT_526534 [Mytilinidion resinicola]
MPAATGARAAEREAVLLLGRPLASPMRPATLVSAGPSAPGAAYSSVCQRQMRSSFCHLERRAQPVIWQAPAALKSHKIWDQRLTASSIDRSSLMRYQQRSTDGTQACPSASPLLPSRAKAVIQAQASTIALLARSFPGKMPISPIPERPSKRSIHGLHPITLCHPPSSHHSPEPWNPSLLRSVLQQPLI